MYTVRVILKQVMYLKQVQLSTNVFIGFALGILLGIGITLARKKAEKLIGVFDAGSQAMYIVTNVVMGFSPIGVTALIAASVGEYGLKIFGLLGKFILADYVC